MSENINPIPARLKNVSEGGHVAGAVDIIDDVKNMTQDAINVEVDNALTLHQSEINALDSQNYVTVDTYSDLPATGSVDTVYRVCNWDGSANSGAGAVDATVYSEYAWDDTGSDYKLLDVKTAIGEVFDISLYNAVGGVLATYADLSAALGVDGANVPSGVRKGGMSVKYVHSIDNKYVQFRYRGTDVTTVGTFTNTANWQEYKSDSIGYTLSTRIKDKNGVVCECSQIHYDNGVGITNDGSLAYNVLYGITDYICIKGLNKIIINTKIKSSNLSTLPLCIFYDEGKNIISVIAAEQETTVNRSIQVPTNAFYIRSQAYCYEYNDFSILCDENIINIPINVIKLVSSDVRNLELTLVSSVVDKYNNILPLSKINDNNGFYFDTSGNYGYNAAYCSTPYVSLEGIAEFTYIGHIRTTHISFIPAILYYDANKNYIGYVLITQDISEHNPQVLQVSEIPSNAVYARFQTFKDAKDFRITIDTSGIDFRLDRIEKQIQFEGAVYEDKKSNVIYENKIQAIKETAGFCSCIHKWGFIGDSLSSGLFQWIESGSEPQFTDYTYSWGQRLIAMIGQAVGTNWSVGGMTAESWFQRYVTNRVDGYNIDNIGTKFDDDLKQAYTIMLGTNDKNSGVAVGNAETDIDFNDYNNNADTYIGNYAKIIQKIKDLQPSAKIFVLTIPQIFSANMETLGYNPAIRQMPNLFSNVYLVDVANYIPNISTALKEKFVNDGHGTSTGYQWYAYIVSTLIDNIIENNLDSFKWVCRIGTQYDDGNL